MKISNAGAPQNALVIGASGGIGNAFVAALCDLMPGDAVNALSRSGDGFDVTDEKSIIAAAEQFASDGQSFDLIFNAAGTLEPAGEGPEKSFDALSPEVMQAAFATNTIGPALVLKHFAPLLSKDQRSVFATLSARVGSIGDNRLGGWMSYRSSKAALNQIVRCASIEFARSHRQSVIVALHPGTIETALTKKYAKGRYTDTSEGAARSMISVLQDLTPKDTGKFFDYAGKEILW
ncbi:MAG: SDR family NAD(P)-dependent oxidoreductase [Marinicaulis sp.]|nr:SDR family NAD(P)-dependent oxidoreductase [Marinicaulis sp.]NNL89276.1 SDR family NAD(P)-dependent oxidoreductase [Marinicaulis sp.]